MVQELIRLPEDKLNIGDAALRLSTLVMTEVQNTDAERRMLDDIAAKAANLMQTKGRDDPEARIKSINTVLWEMGFRYAFDDLEFLNPENSTLLAYLRTKKGNCASMPILWYAIAERLGFPVFAVEAPSHLFLRYDDGKYRINVETTSYSSIPDDRYIAKFEIPDIGVKSGAYMRSLSKRELLAALISITVQNVEDPFLQVELLLNALPLNPKSVGIHWGLARAYDQMFYARLSRDHYPPESKRLPPEGDLAAEHAIAATKLGAGRPFEYYRLKMFQKPIDKSIEKMPTVAPEPFNVLSVIMKDVPRVHISHQWQVDPVLYESALLDPDSCLLFAARFCGAPPGNACAVDVIQRSRHLRGLPFLPGGPMMPRAPRVP